MRRFVINVGLVAAALIAALVTGILSAAPAVAQTEQTLLGRHRFASQWISWQRFGAAVIARGAKPGEYFVTGYQPGRFAGQARAADFLSMHGIITNFSGKTFTFTGRIALKIHHSPGSDGQRGTVCLREGTFQFAATKGRKFWRLQAMRSPCGTQTDYVDIFFR